jgi:MFS family permease
MQAFITQILSIHQFAFLKLLSYRVCMVLSYQIMAVAVGWHLYEITRDPLSLGLIGLAEVIPYFATALFAGHAVDHYCSRRFFGMISALLLAANALTLTLLSTGYIHGKATFWIYASIAITGLARAFIAPSYHTLFGLIIPRDLTARASGVGTIVFQIGLISGPAIGGLLVGFASKTTTYAVSSALALLGALAMSQLRLQEPKSDEDTPVIDSIKQGLQFVFSNQIILGALSLDMFAVLFGGAVAMLPAFVKDVYQIGPEGLGLLRAMPAVGAIFTGLWLTRHPVNHHAGRYLLIAVAGFGLCIIGFGLVSSIYVAGVMLLLSGVCDGVSVVLRQTILQLATPQTMRGRVSSINGVFIGSSNELGAFESGVAARILGLVPSVIFGGLVTLGVVGVTAKLAPKLRDLELQQLH